MLPTRAPYPTPNAPLFCPEVSRRSDASELEALVYPKLSVAFECTEDRVPDPLLKTTRSPDLLARKPYATRQIKWSSEQAILPALTLLGRLSFVSSSRYVALASFALCLFPQSDHSCLPQVTL